MKKLFKYSTIIYLLFLSFSVTAQTPTLPPLPMDPKVKYGKQPNGLTYYIRANKLPKERADFYIVQNVGAILENDNQNGLAHFLEHMAFNGTKHFPKKGLLNFFEKNGVRFGYNINAYTNLDETVYMIMDVPTYRSSLLDSTLLALHDWSGCISLEEKEIDDERGVILEEWRIRFVSDFRMWRESNRLKFPNSQYAKRDIIGDTAIINHFSYQALRDYYAKWYRPDQQAIVIVGDVNPEQMEAKLKSTFSDIPRRENPAERTIYTIADNSKPIISIVQDKEAMSTKIDILYKHNKLPIDEKLSVKGFEISTINDLISSMIEERFDEITQQPDATIVSGRASYGELVKSKDAFSFTVVPKEGHEEEGLKALLVEVEKIKRFGFTESELARAKAKLLSKIENKYKERENENNSNYSKEYINHFLKNRPSAGIEWENTYGQTLLPKLKLGAINKIAKQYISADNQIIAIETSEKTSIKPQDSTKIISLMAEVKIAKIQNKGNQSQPTNLISKTPKAGSITKTTENQQLGTTEWVLSNGIKVIIKPTNFKKDEIKLVAFSEGGLSLVNNISDLPTAKYLSSVMDNNGIGDFSSNELKKILAGKMAGVGSYIDDDSHSIWGYSSNKDIETMLKLVYLKFTAPRTNKNAFKSTQNKIRSQISSRIPAPYGAFMDTLLIVLESGHPRHIVENNDMVNTIDENKAMEIYKNLFLSKSSFTYVIVGSIDPKDESFQKMVCTYIGGLPSGSANTKYIDHNVRIPKGKVKKYFSKEMLVPIAVNAIIYSADLSRTLQNSLALKAIGDILTIRYTESIREKEGGAYFVSANGSVDKYPIEKAKLMMFFATNPKKQEKLMSIIHSEIAEILKNGPRQDDFQKVKENLLKQHSQDLENNKWWQNSIVSYNRDGINLATDYKAAVESLTPELLVKTLENIVAQDNVIEVVMTPKK